MRVSLHHNDILAKAGAFAMYSLVDGCYLTAPYPFISRQEKDYGLSA